jgi:hypothetical protein
MNLPELRTPRRRQRRLSTSAPPSGIGLRLRVRLHGWRLDHELADGCVSGNSQQRDLRARQLADGAARRRVARSLRRVVVDAESPRVVLGGSTVPLLRHVIVPLREALLGLADRLEQPGPVNPCGVARALVVLTDGTGPLYHRTPQRSLADAIWWIAEGLQLCAPHDWRCPVIMKLDPDHVAWTCARCGTTVTTDDAAVMPE